VLVCLVSGVIGVAAVVIFVFFFVIFVPVFFTACFGVFGWSLFFVCCCGFVWRIDY